ncbi:hypothetical protein ACWFNE_00115 [Cellulomonas sp. NPDC055163]
MTHLSLAPPAPNPWPNVVLTLGLVLFAFLIMAAVIAFVSENRKMKIDAARENDLRQLVDRYEQLAEKTMDAQQRTAADVAELRSRTTAIEQILRTVE